MWYLQGIHPFRFEYVEEGGTGFVHKEVFEGYRTFVVDEGT
jgi:hypothetical protein